MTAIPVLTRKESMDIEALSHKYGADEGLVATIYMGIKSNSNRDVAECIFNFPSILTERALKDLGYKRQTGYKPI